MSDRYADHDAAWHRDMETEAAAQEPREDVFAFEIVRDKYGSASDEEHDEAVAALDALQARLEEWEGIARRNADLVDEAKARLEQTERERDEAMEAMAAAWKDTNAAERALEELLLHPDPLDARFVELQRTAEARMEELQRERDEERIRANYERDHRLAAERERDWNLTNYGLANERADRAEARSEALERERDAALASGEGEER